MTWSEVPSISDGTDLYAQSVGAIQGKAGNNFFVTSNQIKNPSSELMMMPFGLLIAQYDQAYNIVKKQYAENCRILNRSDSRNPQSAMVEESGQISPFKIVATTIDIGFKKKIEFEIASTP
jgi:hypothetical protein